MQQFSAKNIPQICREFAKFRSCGFCWHDTQKRKDNDENITPSQVNEGIVNPSDGLDNNNEYACMSRSEPAIANENYQGGYDHTDTTPDELESRSESENHLSDMPALEDKLIEEELLNEMTSGINADDDESLNKSDLDDEDEFFDNDDQDLLHRIDDLESELIHHNYNDSLSQSFDSNATVSNAENVHSYTPTENDEVIDDGADRINTRPRRANAGTGATIFEPTWGGKQHLEYKKKCFLQQKREERNTHRARISLLITKERKKAKNKIHLMQLVVNQVFLSAQMSARKGMKLFGERAITAIIKECEQLDRGAFPDKPVVEPMYEHDLTDEEK